MDLSLQWNTENAATHMSERMYMRSKPTTQHQVVHLEAKAMADLRCGVEHGRDPAICADTRAEGGPYELDWDASEQAIVKIAIGRAVWGVQADVT